MSVISKKGRQRRGFTKRSGLILAVLLTLSLGLIGSAMALWGDSLTIEQTVGTAVWQPELYNSISGTVTDNLEMGTTTSSGGTFTFNFKIKNSGEVPLTFTTTSPVINGDVSVDPSGVAPATGNLDPGAETQISVTGTLQDNPDPTVNANGTVKVAFQCKQWNAPSSGYAWQKDLTFTGTVDETVQSK